MMYDGMDYQGISGNRKGKSSSRGRKHPYQQEEFYSKPENQYWNNGTYTEESKKHCIEHLIKTIANGEKRIYKWIKKKK